MLQEIIIETLKYFDVQEHPLTLLEIANFLIWPAGAQKPVQEFNVADILTALDSMPSQVQEYRGYYFLSGRQEIAQKRWQNNLYSTPRMKRAAKYLKLAKHVPFVAAVAVSGSEALNNSRQGSDIDLLVLTKKNRLWLGRFFITALFQTLGMRRHGKLVSNRFCLNHYVETGKQIDNDRNLYTAIEYSALIPFYGGDEIFRFQRENESWIKTFLLQPKFIEYGTPESSGLKLFLERVLSGKIGDLLESSLGRYQMKRIHIGDFITVEQNELSFHPGSKGQQVLSRFKEQKV